MGASTVNGSRNRARSGARTLTLLVGPLILPILRSLTDGAKQQAQLRREAGSPAQTTLRAQLQKLDEAKAIEKHRRNRFPGVLEYELTVTGRELLFVATTLERWLDQMPDGPLRVDGSAARAAVKALAEGWSSAMLRALASGPLTLTELDNLIGALNYPALERRLGAMRLSSLVSPVPDSRKGTPYAVTDWLRHGVGALIAASRWERRHLADTSPPIGRTDVEAVLLLAMPLIRPGTETSGVCSFVVELANGSRSLATITAAVEEGHVRSGSSRDTTIDAWVSGSTSAWLRAAIDGDRDYLELGGDVRLARNLLDGLHQVLFREGVDVGASISEDLAN